VATSQPDVESAALPVNRLGSRSRNLYTHAANYG
jgi:hypothetical protein